MNYPMIAGAMTLALMGTGCATKKYVAKTIAPVEARVQVAEAKNGQQDTELATQRDQIDTLESDLSLTNERLADAANTAETAQTSAQRAQTTADGANTLAGRANTLATNAMEVAENGLSKANEVEAKVDMVNNFQLAASETVLFGFDAYGLTADAKAKLDSLASRVNGTRYMVEVQGYTDKVGNAAYNEQLSEKRADAVARYLVNEHKVALRSINMMGSGYATPVADDTTAEGRKMNRRVEVRLFVPELTNAVRRASN